ncbi:MAG TPA: sugar ABC transporter permease [Thermotogales bacterium]|nr:sugar ABC transporter permease [Thermotogales bacterium]
MKRRKNLMWYFRKYKFDLFLALPGILLLVIFYVAPVIAVFFVSFTRWPIIGAPKWIGLKNYQMLMSDRIFFKSLLNTLYYAALIVPSLTIFSFILALILRAITKGREFFKAVFVFPMVVTLVSTATIWKGLFLPFGPINAVLEFLGLPTVQFLSAEHVKNSLSFILIWRDVGYFSIFYLAGFEQIPTEIIDAAKVDGANALQRFTYIIWPMMRPIVVLVSILSTIGSFMIFTLVYVTTRGGPAYSSEALLNYIYDVGWKEFRMGYAAAAAVVYFVILFLLNSFQRLVFSRE